MDELKFGPGVIDGEIEDVVLNDGRRIWVDDGEDVEPEGD